MKTFTLQIEIQEKNTPQQWQFSAGVPGLEQVAIWAIIAKLGQQELNKLLSPQKQPANNPANNSPVTYVVK